MPKIRCETPEAESAKNCDRLVPVFRSSDPESFAMAITLLKAGGIHHRAVDRQEGSSKFPRLVHMIEVPCDLEEEALEILSDIPSEIILPDHHTEITPADRMNAWLMLIPLIVIIVLALIATLMS